MKAANRATAVEIAQRRGARKNKTAGGTGLFYEFRWNAAVLEGHSRRR